MSRQPARPGSEGGACDQDEDRHSAEARRASAAGHRELAVDPARSRASFRARIAGLAVRGSLPLTGHVVIAALDRLWLLVGPSFLDVAAFPEITFRSELLA